MSRPNIIAPPVSPPPPGSTKEVQFLHRNVATAITRLVEQVNRIDIPDATATSTGTSTTTVIINNGGSGSGGGTIGPTLVTQWFTLSTATTTITPTSAGNDNSLLVLSLLQDATGGRLVSFASSLKGVQNTDIDRRPSYRTIFTFVGKSDGNWYKIASSFGSY